MAVAVEEKVYEVEGLGPARVERSARSRSVEFVWKLGEKPGREGPKSVLAVLRVGHHKAGYNYFNGEYTTEDYFSVSLKNEEEEVGSVFTSRSFFVGRGLGLLRVPAGNRYSAKKLREAADKGFAFFRALYEEGHPDVMRYFDPEVAEA